MDGETHEVLDEIRQETLERVNKLRRYNLRNMADVLREPYEVALRKYEKRLRVIDKLLLRGKAGW
jgi:hypothetical protein